MPAPASPITDIVGPPRTSMRPRRSLPGRGCTPSFTVVAAATRQPHPGAKLLVPNQLNVDGKPTKISGHRGTVNPRSRAETLHLRCLQSWSTASNCRLSRDSWSPASSFGRTVKRTERRQFVTKSAEKAWDGCERSNRTTSAPKRSDLGWLTAALTHCLSQVGNAIERFRAECENYAHLRASTLWTSSSRLRLTPSVTEHLPWITTDGFLRRSRKGPS